MKMQVLDTKQGWVFIGAIVGLVITIGFCAVYFTLDQSFQAKRITDAQVTVYKAQADNVGKPQIIEQRYYSPGPTK